MTQNNYKFTILSLALVNQAYPLDFFIRIRANNQQQYEDSPIIQTNQMQCQQQFPWQFIVNRYYIQLQFIQISPSSGIQIVRGKCNIQNMTNGDSQVVIILANRTGKKLCMLTYKLERNNESNKFEQMPTRAKKNHFEQQNFDQSNKQQEQQKQNNLSKQEQNQLSKQIAYLSKSIDKILTHQKVQHEKFNKYLDQSNNFLRQLAYKTKQNSRANESLITQSIEQYPQNRKKTGQKIQQIQQIDKQQQNQITSRKWYSKKYHKTMSQVVKQQIFKKQVLNLSQSKVQQASIQYYNSSNQEQQQSFIFSNFSFDSQIKPNQVTFSSYDKQNPLVKIKSTQGGYQWGNIIKLDSLPAYIIKAKKGNQKELQGCIAKKQLQQQRVNLYDLKGELRGCMKFIFKKIKIFSVQTQALLDMPKLQIKQQNNIQEKLQQSNLQSVGQKYNENKYEQSSRASQIYSKKASRLMIKSQQKKQAKGYNQKQQMQNKEGLNYISQRSNRYQLLNNQLEVKFIPSIKKRHLTQKPSQRQSRSSYLQGQNENTSDEGNPKFLSNTKKTNIKIDSISIKLTKNLNQFIGKYAKVSMKNKSPFVTQSISLSQNLIWKGKGYFFDNISTFSQLKIELCSNERGKQKIQGTSKICLALLNIQRYNSVQFYHDYLRDQKQSQMGELILGYECLDKTRRNNKNDGFDEQQKADGFKKQHEGINKKHRNSTNSRPKLRKKVKSPLKKQNNKNIGIHASNAKSIVGSASIIRTKKYTGGNIFIGRAARFKTQSGSKPGPGQYQIASSFQNSKPQV